MAARVEAAGGGSGAVVSRLGHLSAAREEGERATGTATASRLLWHGGWAKRERQLACTCTAVEVPPEALAQSRDNGRRPHLCNVTEGRMSSCFPTRRGSQTTYNPDPERTRLPTRYKYPRACSRPPCLPFCSSLPLAAPREASPPLLAPPNCAPACAHRNHGERRIRCEYPPARCRAPPSCFADSLTALRSFSSRVRLSGWPHRLPPC